MPFPCHLFCMFLPMPILNSKMIELRAIRRAEAVILDDIVGTYLTEFVKDIVRETLKAGLLAKKRAEDEVRVGIYNIPHAKETDTIPRHLLSNLHPQRAAQWNIRIISTTDKLRWYSGEWCMLFLFSLLSLIGAVYRDIGAINFASKTKYGIRSRSVEATLSVLSVFHLHLVKTSSILDT